MAGPGRDAPAKCGKSRSGAKVSQPTLMFCDNKAACMLSESNLSSRRMRHVATRLAYLKERVKSGELQLVHVGTDGNVADIGTKALGTKAFHRLRCLLVR